jgi:hypothetical protein
MSSLQDIIDLCNNDNGKVFVVDEEGNVKLVILNIEEYQRLLLGKLKKKVQDVEVINQEILKAQIQEDTAPSLPPVPLGPALAQRAEELFRARPAGSRSQPDLRSEVIDPNFDFEAPKIGLDDL